MSTDTRDGLIRTALEINAHAPPDLGIVRVLSVLIDAAPRIGLRMAESCDGSPGHAYPDPTVTLVCSAGAAWQAAGLVLDAGFPLLHLRQVWSFSGDGPERPVWELVFRPEVRGGLVTPETGVYYEEVCGG